MTEQQIGALYKIASVIAHEEKNCSQRILESFYMMRCKDITKGYGLPAKYFSTSKRCSHCCLEWKKGTTVLIKHKKLSKRQKKRYKSRIRDNCKDKNQKKMDLLLYCDEIEQICSFCKKSTSVPTSKTNDRKYLSHKVKNEENIRNTDINEDLKIIKAAKHTPKLQSVANVYNYSKDVFSLRNERNILSTSIKQVPKVIKNSKKKKDKFAGLCHKAVLTSAKLKAEKDKVSNKVPLSEKETKTDKLSLFLRPSL